MLPDAAPLEVPAPDSDRGRDLIKRARQIRRDAGVGFRAMADRLGIARSTLSRYETAGPPAPGRVRGPWDIPAYWVAILDVLDRETG